MLYALMIALTVFVGAKALAEIRAFNRADDAAARTITLQGTGEVFAIPDIATVTYTVTSQKETVAAAQADVTAKSDAAIAFLKKSGIEDRDIKTVNYVSYPRYESEPVRPCYGGGFCGTTQGKIIGYELSHTVSAKIRKTDTAGAVLQGLGDIGVTNISGPDFGIDEEESLLAEARGKAIADAKAKAKVLAKQLGVRLGDITSFSEGNTYPMYYAKDMAYGMGAAENASAPAPTPTIPAGENKIVSNVSVTYEIR